VSGLSARVQTQASFDRAQSTTQRRETLSVSRMWQVVYAFRVVQSAHEQLYLIHQPATPAILPAAAAADTQTDRVMTRHRVVIETNVTRCQLAYEFDKNTIYICRAMCLIRSIGLYAGSLLL
jgi:hypothetical protein